MSSVWTFSSSSEPYLQRCIIAAPPPDPNNKWFIKFGKKHSPVETATEIKKKSASNLENSSSGLEEDATISYEHFFDTIESESTFPLDFVIQECTKNPALGTKMAEKLSTNTTEELFKHIFSKKHLETDFLTTFFRKFLPTFIKVRYSRLCIDLLVKTNEKYPHIFRQLLEILINDTEIPNQVLNNYIAVLNEETLTNFIETLSKIEISSEGFLQNVSAIYTAYKDSFKTDIIQNYIQNILISNSKNCASDRHFGRLFLAYLQADKSMGRKVNVKLLEECLQLHRSPFKRPCSMLLEEIINE